MSTYTQDVVNMKRKFEDTQDEFSDISDEETFLESINQIENEYLKLKRVNSELNSFVCEICSKCFANRSKLISHRLCHLAAVICQTCGKRFSRSSNLRRHEKKAHSIEHERKNKSLRCDLCFKIFTRISNLNRHKNSVHAEKQTKRSSKFTCRHCFEEYKDYNSLFHHVATSHPINQEGGEDNIRIKTPTVESSSPVDENQIDKKDDSSNAIQSKINTAKGRTKIKQSKPDNPHVNENALKNGVHNRYIHPQHDERYDLLTFFANVRSQIKEFLLSRTSKVKGVKWNLCVQVEMRRDDGDEQKILTPFFRSRTYISLSAQDFSEHDLNQALQIMHGNMEKFMKEGSSWYVSKIIKLEIHTIMYNPLSGSTYIPLPLTLTRTGSILNIQNADLKCFTYSILAAIHPVQESPENVQHYKKFEYELNMKDIQYPVTLSQINKFETNNEHISVNVFTYENKEILPLRITKQSQRFHHVNLLWITCGHDSHYCLIKNLNRFLARTKSHKSTTHFCPYCLHGFIRKDLLDCHLPICSTHDPQKAELPIHGVNDVLKFKEYERTVKVGFTIYADLECLNSRIATCYPNPEKSSTTCTSKLEVCSFGYKVVCENNKFTKPAVVYRGPDVVTKFIQCLLKEQSEIEQILNNVVPMNLTDQDIKLINETTHCCICEKQFESLSETVRHHNHITGTFIGLAHNSCNILCRQAKHTCVVFHNLKNFDAHILCEGIGKFKDEKIKCIAQNTERFVSFSLGNLRFIDSYQFLPSSLETLVDNLSQDGINAFQHLRSEFPNKNKCELLLRKGVYPYEYMDSLNKFEETQLPSIESFYSTLKKEELSEEDYNHATSVFSAFDMHNLGEYHDIYLKTDVILLSDVFESFRNVCMGQYKLDPCYFYTSPGLSWSSCLKMTGVELQLITDIDQHLFVEAGIRGGLSQISNRYKQANNPYLQNYDSTQPTSYLTYLDMNNLYGWAMIQHLPTGNFEFLNDDEIHNLDILNISDNGDIGYILEVSLKYPTALHQLHNDYPLAPERTIVEDDQLSPYAKHLWKVLNGKEGGDEFPSRSKVSKLVTSLNDKKHYIVHYRNLQLYVKLGLEITQIHRVLQFHQEPWMAKYINYNTEMRKKATSTFQKNFYKLMNVSVFGKTMENVRKHRNIELVHTKRRLNKLSAKPTYQTAKIINEDLVAVEMGRMKVKLSKPSYCGMSVLDLSKWLMYDFYYHYIKRKYGTKSQLQMTDTDSILVYCQTEDIYKDMEADLDLFDTSDYPTDHFLYSTHNKKVLGKMKDETNSKPISEFVGLRSKMYCFLCDDKEEKRAKGVAKTTVKKDIKLKHYKDTLFNETQKISSMTSIRSHSHELVCETINKRSLSAFDDKRYLINPVESYAYGHYKINDARHEPLCDNDESSADEITGKSEQYSYDSFLIDDNLVTPVTSKIV